MSENNRGKTPRLDRENREQLIQILEGSANETELDQATLDYIEAVTAGFKGDEVEVVLADGATPDADGATPLTEEDIEYINKEIRDFGTLVIDNNTISLDTFHKQFLDTLHEQFNEIASIQPPHTHDFTKAAKASNEGEGYDISGPPNPPGQPNPPKPSSFSKPQGNP